LALGDLQIRPPLARDHDPILCHLFRGKCAKLRFDDGDGLPIGILIESRHKILAEACRHQPAGIPLAVVLLFTSVFYVSDLAHRRLTDDLGQVGRIPFPVCVRRSIIGLLQVRLAFDLFEMGLLGVFCPLNRVVAVVTPLGKGNDAAFDLLAQYWGHSQLDLQPHLVKNTRPVLMRLFHTLTVVRQAGGPATGPTVRETRIARPPRISEKYCNTWMELLKLWRSHTT